MLVLTRQLNEAILIGDDIEVSIEEIQQYVVRIRIRDPRCTCHYQGGASVFGVVLGRRKEDVILIGDEIEICVVNIRLDAVKIGIKAPRTRSVHRKEIFALNQVIEKNKSYLDKRDIPSSGTMSSLEGWIQRKKRTSTR